MVKNKLKKGQLSIELILILAILLGVVFLVASKMRESAQKASSSIGNTSEKIYGEIENITTTAPYIPIQSKQLLAKTTNTIFLA